MPSDRQKKLLRKIINNFVKTAEPLSSGFLVGKIKKRLSLFLNLTVEPQKFNLSTVPRVKFSTGNKRFYLFQGLFHFLRTGITQVSPTGDAIFE